MAGRQKTLLWVDRQGVGDLDMYVGTVLAGMGKTFLSLSSDHPAASPASLVSTLSMALFSKITDMAGTTEPEKGMCWVAAGRTGGQTIYLWKEEKEKKNRQNEKRQKQAASGMLFRKAAQGQHFKLASNVMKKEKAAWPFLLVTN